MELLVSTTSGSVSTNLLLLLPTQDTFDTFLSTPATVPSAKPVRSALDKYPGSGTPSSPLWEPPREGPASPLCPLSLFSTSSQSNPLKM